MKRMLAVVGLVLVVVSVGYAEEPDREGIRKILLETYEFGFKDGMDCGYAYGLGVYYGVSRLDRLTKDDREKDFVVFVKNLDRPLLLKRLHVAYEEGYLMGVKGRLNQK